MIHPEAGMNPKGEIDVLGVRFPHRSELLLNSMRDDGRFTAFDKPLIVLGEVKRGRPEINETWREPSRRNMECILRLVGVFPLDRTTEAAAALYRDGFYADEHHHLSVVAFGSHVSPTLTADLPHVMQITWREVAAFIYGRFDQHRKAKHFHDQWDADGKAIWTLHRDYRTDPDGFRAALEEACGLRDEAA